MLSFNFKLHLMYCGHSKGDLTHQHMCVFRFYDPSHHRQSDKTEKKPKAKTSKGKKKSNDVTFVSNEQSTNPPEEESTTATTTTNNLTAIMTNNPSLLSNLLLEIQSLSNDKKRCTAALQALKDGKDIAMPLSTLGEDEDDDASTTALGDTKLSRGKKRGAGGGDKKSSVHKDPFE
jgi:hypothetical protein